jgi:CDP-glucose 4,6-dehydratase
LELQTMFTDAYCDKVVLITGHTGFKGSWLAIWLLKLGARVAGYSLDPPTTPSLFETCGLANHVQDLRGDIRDTAGVARVIRDVRPDFIFHLAAAPLVLRSYEDPIGTFDVNVMGTLSVLQAIREARQACSVVVVSSDKCYRNCEWDYGYRENDPFGGHDPYSASKAAMEIAVASYRDSFFPASATAQHGVHLASARAGNVIGGGDWAVDRIVPDAVRALHAGEVLKVRSPDAIRPWQHVLEPLSGYLALGASLAGPRGDRFAGGWNFGPLASDVFTVADLVDTAIRAWGSGSWQTGINSAAPHEAGLLRLCIDKAIAQLGWRPVWDFDEAVRRTVLWYSDYFQQPKDEAEAFDSCVSDIAAYEAAASQKGIAWSLQTLGMAARS